MIDTHRITGAARDLGGKVQGALGDLTGSRRDSVEGRAREAAGQGEALYGQAKDTVRDAADHMAEHVADHVADHLADAARDLGGRVRNAVDDLGADDIEARARRAQGAAHDQYARAGRGVRHAAELAYDTAEDAYARGGHALRRGTREVGEQVAEYPLAALLIAGIAGFGLGLLVSARRD